jgi:hypothetical protein
MLFNALDYPAVAFPVTTVDQERDVIIERTSFYSDADKANYEMCASYYRFSCISGTKFMTFR